jgi:hypothetical protein
MQCRKFFPLLIAPLLCRIFFFSGASAATNDILGGPETNDQILNRNEVEMEVGVHSNPLKTDNGDGVIINEPVVNNDGQTLPPSDKKYVEKIWALRSLVLCFFLVIVLLLILLITLVLEPVNCPHKT